MLEAALRHMDQNPHMDQGGEFGRDHHVDALAKCAAKIAKLRAPRDPEVEREYHAARRSEIQDEYAREAELRATASEFRKENPTGPAVLNVGSADYARLHEKVASKPLSATKADAYRDNARTCSYCGRSHAAKIKRCSRCQKAAFCDEGCMKAAWKGHKLVCEPAANPGPESQESGSRTGKGSSTRRLLTWGQLEVLGGAPAIDQAIEIRAVLDESHFGRQVFGCKDRDGSMRRVAVYTNSRRIPGLEQGCMLRWKHPRYHWFLDGSSGARIEEGDLANITVIPVGGSSPSPKESGSGTRKAKKLPTAKENRTTSLQNPTSGGVGKPEDRPGAGTRARAGPNPTTMADHAVFGHVPFQSSSAGDGPAGGMKQCGTCHAAKPISAFTNSQLKKKAQRRCRDCADGDTS